MESIGSQHESPARRNRGADRPALAEDIGPGDVTANATVPADRVAQAHIVPSSQGHLRTGRGRGSLSGRSG